MKLYFVNTARKMYHVFVLTIFYFSAVNEKLQRGFLLSPSWNAECYQNQEGIECKPIKGLVSCILVSFVIKFRGLLHYDKIIINTIQILYKMFLFPFLILVILNRTVVTFVFNFNDYFYFNMLKNWTEIEYIKALKSSWNWSLKANINTA